MSSQNPIVSIIIPNYNHAKFLVDRIESVLNQTFQDFEVIILDDCSTDNSRKIINSYKTHPKIEKVIFNTENSGSTFSQWNKGVALANGKYIWFAESDDICELNFLEKLIAKIEKNNKIDLIYCQSNIIDDHNQPSLFLGFEKYPNSVINKIFENDFYLKGSDFVEKYLLNSNLIPNASSVIVRKSRFLEIGGAYNSMKLFGDWLTWIKILSKDSYIYYVGEQLSSFRNHKNTVRNTVYNKSSTFFEYLKLYDEIIILFPNLRKIVLDKIVYRYLIYKSNNIFTSIELKAINIKLKKYDNQIWIYILKSYLKRFIWK